MSQTLETRRKGQPQITPTQYEFLATIRDSRPPVSQDAVFEALHLQNPLTQTATLQTLGFINEDSVNTKLTDDGRKALAVFEKWAAEEILVYLYNTLGESLTQPVSFGELQTHLEMPYQRSLQCLLKSLMSEDWLRYVVEGTYSIRSLDSGPSCGIRQTRKGRTHAKTLPGVKLPNKSTWTASLTFILLCLSLIVNALTVPTSAITLWKLTHPKPDATDNPPVRAPTSAAAPSPTSAPAPVTATAP